MLPGQGLVPRNAMENLIKTVLRLERTVCKRDPTTGFCATKPPRLSWVSSAADHAGNLERMDTQPLAHRERQPLRAQHRLRRGRLPHPKEPRHRRPPAILRLQHHPSKRRRQCPKHPMARRSRISA